MRDRPKPIPAPVTGIAAVEKVIKDPTVRFDSPAAVLADPALTEEQKETILTSWVKDAELLAEAENENMGGGERSRLHESLPHPPEDKKPE